MDNSRREGCVLKSFVRAAIVLTLPLLSACGVPAQGPDPAAALARADWSKAETVTLTMTEHAFSPLRITFREGLPSRLVLRNAGSEPHYFVAEEFFRTVATRKIQGSDGEVKAPYLTAVEVYPRKTLEWFLVPLKTGTFDVVCTIPGHAEQGMKGKIEVR